MRWRHDYAAPAGVTVTEFVAELRALPEPSPEHLLEAARREDHLLHPHLFSESDEVWAERGRLAQCRHWIGNVVGEIKLRGGSRKTIEIRTVERVPPSENGTKKPAVWMFVDDIVNDAELAQRVLNEAMALFYSGLAKMERWRELVEAGKSPPSKRPRRKSSEQRPAA